MEPARNTRDRSTAATMKPDTPKLHFAWSGTNSGISNPRGEKHRIYYGKTFRIPRDATLDVEKHHEIENRELDELTANAIDQSCADGGKPAVSEFLERYDVLDVETGDVLVMYRVPYKPDDEKPVRPITAPPIMSRKARRSAAKRGEITGDFLNCPPSLS